MHDKRPPFSSHLSFIKYLVLYFSMLALGSCGGASERPEVISKLRALGVEQLPVNAKPGDTVNLTFYLAAPPKTSITALVLSDGQARYSLPIAVTPIDTVPSEVTIGPLSLFAYRAKFTVPVTPAVQLQLAKLGFARIRYQVKFTSEGQDESIVGDTVVYPEGSANLTWTAPEIAITKPAATAPGGALDLEGSISSSGNESYRVSWFVSAGTIKNRRSKTTVWENSPSDARSVFFTVRGTKSGAFSIKAQAVVSN